MKKIEIIQEYNKLGKELLALVTKVTELTNETSYAYTGNMDNGAMYKAKHELEYMLSDRQRLITEYRNKIDMFYHTEEMKQSEEGKKFIADNEAKIQELCKKMEDIAGVTTGSFHELLDSIGMSDWRMRDGVKLMPSFRGNTYITLENVQHKDLPWHEISLIIGSPFRWHAPEEKWKMSISVGCSGNTDIREKDSDYYRSKAYVTVIDHSEEIMEWLNTVFNTNARQMTELEDECDKYVEISKNPYDAWIAQQTA